MPCLVTKDPPEIVLTGPDWEPADGSLARASDLDRQSYWRQLSLFARDRKYAELNRGLDVTGAPLVPRKHPRHDGATGPVLDPHWSKSRFETELRWEQRRGREAVLYWKQPWATIVTIWALRIAAPQRDVVGLTPESLDKIRGQIRRWWAARLARKRTNLAGVTVMPGDAARIVAATKNGTFTGLRKPLARPSGSPFAGPTSRPAVPSWTRPEPAWRLSQQIHDWWLSAGARGQATERQAESIVRRLGRSQSEATLKDLAYRLGVDRPLKSKNDALNTIEANLKDRLRSARPTRPAPAPVPIAQTVTAPAQGPAGALDLTARIETAFRRLAPDYGAARVRLADLRAVLGDVPRDLLDAWLLRLAIEGRINLTRFDDPLAITPADRAAALYTPSGEVRHLLSWRS